MDCDVPVTYVYIVLSCPNIQIDVLKVHISLSVHTYAHIHIPISERTILMCNIFKYSHMSPLFGMHISYFEIVHVNNY